MSEPRLPTRSAAKPEALSRPSTRSGPPAAERPTGADSSLPDPRSSLAPAKPCEAGIPFSVHREGQATLTDQIVRGLAQAIRSGHYADGQKLPTIMGLSEALEEQLSQAQKMIAIGQLAGGIAHDLNNQLTPVMGYAEMLVICLEDERLRKYADNILKSATRAAHLTRDLLAFARKGKFLSTEVDVHRVIVETVTMLERSIDKRISVRQLLNAHPSHVKGDPTQLQNALLNLALNARDAMPSGGELTFATTVTELPERAFGFALAAGRYLQLSVIDTGVGMDEETRKHLFEPFFTTKEKGKGTGLGLAAVYGTVKNHHGAILAQSQLGRGAEFAIYLPVLESVSADEPAATGDGAPAHGNARILIVDDEKDVGDLVSDVLRDLGYKVTACNSSEEAIDYYAKAWEHIDLVILNMVMPKMGGRDVFVAMRRINLHIKALLVSGYSLDSEAQSILDSGVLGFLQKPFRSAELSRKVAEVLRGA